jgi:hypothetical protein
MGKIVRLTESDLVRIVKRVINEGVAGPYTVGGLSYNVQTFGDGNIGYVSVKEPGTVITDSRIITALNAKSGLEIPPASGKVLKGYVQQHKSQMPKLAAFLGI